jgi:hypothetical protein
VVESESQDNSTALKVETRPAVVAAAAAVKLKTRSPHAKTNSLEQDSMTDEVPETPSPSKVTPKSSSKSKNTTVMDSSVSTLTTPPTAVAPKRQYKRNRTSSSTANIPQTEISSIPTTDAHSYVEVNENVKLDKGEPVLILWSPYDAAQVIDSPSADATGSFSFLGLVLMPIFLSLFRSVINFIQAR